MRQLLHEFLLLCGSKGKRVKQSVFFGFFDGIFEAMPFCAVFYLFYHLEQLSWNASFRNCCCNFPHWSDRALDYEVLHL